MKKESKWGLEFIESLNPAKYNYVNNIAKLVPFQGDASKEYFGVMAQDIEKYILEQNEIPKNFNIINYSENYMSVNYNELIGPMIKSIQELNQKIKNLEIELNNYKQG